MKIRAERKRSHMAKTARGCTQKGLSSAEQQLETGAEGFKE